MFWSIITLFTALLFAPALPGIVNRVKAFFGGRHGVPLMQVYYDLYKLSRKGAVYSMGSSWVFTVGPLVNIGAMLLALLLVPMSGINALCFFPGDFLLLLYIMAAARIFIVLSALDTGSSFEGMGASREMQFALLAELASFLSLLALAVFTRHYSLSSMLADVIGAASMKSALPVIILIGIAMLIVFLAENCRIPFDDPTTHLELTMIHEVMVLDHSGIDFAYIQYASCLKLWVTGSIVVSILQPFRFEAPSLNYLSGLAAMVLLAVGVGIIESIMARVKLTRVPHLLVGASVFAILALIIITR